MKVRVAVLLTILVGTGVWVRSLSPASTADARPAWWPWTPPPIATLYFPDGQHLFPVSRRLSATDDLPRATLQAWLDGPRASSGLTKPIPANVQIRSFSVSNAVAHIDLSSGFAGGEDSSAATAALVETMTAVPGVRAVSLSVDGRTVSPPAARTPLSYYASLNGLVSVPSTARTARDAISTYMAGPPDTALTGLPGDVRLLKYAYEEDDGLVSLDFSYTPSVRTLALEKPDIMRSVLLGLIASLTEYADVAAVRIDFDGHSRLGLGECSDLLRTPQRRPRLLNDERLLGR
jgi:spore germination protein GerM